MPRLLLLAAWLLLGSASAKKHVVAEGEYSKAETVEQLVSNGIVRLVQDCCFEDAASADTDLANCLPRTNGTVNHNVPGMSVESTPYQQAHLRCFVVTAKHIV